MRKSRAQAAETRARILSTATKMFLDKGLATVGMRDVLAGASLTPGGFYRHFESKDGLIAEASSAAFDRAYAMLESETVGKSRSLICVHLRCSGPNSVIRTRKYVRLP